MDKSTVQDVTTSPQEAFTFLGYEIASSVVEPEQGQALFERVAADAVPALRAAYEKVCQEFADKVDDLADEITAELGGRDSRIELVVGVGR